MKKFILSALVAVASISANAQAQKGSIMTEIQFNPFSNNFNTFRLNDDAQNALKVRYFLNEKNAVRLRLGLGINNTNEKSTSTQDNSNEDPNNYTIATENTETKNKNTQFTIGLGYERHLFTNGRFDVYAGAELGYTLTSYSGEEETSTESKTTVNNNVVNTRSENTITKYSGQNTKENTFSNNRFYASVFTGVDVYLYKGLYVGTELGLKFATGKSACNPSYTVERSGYETTNNTTEKWSYSYDSETGIKTTTENGKTSTENTGIKENSSSFTKLNFYIEPAIRLGWRF